MRQTPSQSASRASVDAAGDLWRCVVAGLVPLLLLGIVVALDVAITALARVLTIPLGFLAWRWVVAGIWVGGLIIAAAVYSIATVRALRQAASWKDFGFVRQTAGVYWTLGVAALIVLLPVILAVALPQHPAH